MMGKWSAHIGIPSSHMLDMPRTGLHSVSFSPSSQFNISSTPMSPDEMENPGPSPIAPRHSSNMIHQRGLLVYISYPTPQPGISMTMPHNTGLIQPLATILKRLARVEIDSANLAHIVNQSVIQSSVQCFPCHRAQLPWHCSS